MISLIFSFDPLSRENQTETANSPSLWSELIYNN